MDLSLILADLGPAGKRAGKSRQQRLYETLKRAILDGRLGSGMSLPSSRRVADEHGLARNSVLYAYEQLRAEGFLVVERRTTRVAQLSPDRNKSPSHAAAQGPMAKLSRRSRDLRDKWQGSEHLPFRSGVPDLALFPWSKWSRYLARAWRRVGSRHLSYAPAGGEPRLRHAISDHLRASRGLHCEPDQVLVTSGAAMAIDLCARMLADPDDRAWMENPGYPQARNALRAAGLRVAGIPVDESGLAATARMWERLTPKLVFVTPTHQYPMGSVMTLERRLELLNRVRRHGAWIIEDDYDCELQHGNRQITALQGLDSNAAVMYVGTFSKALYPSLRLGYMVAPKWVSARIAGGLQQIFRPGQAVEQSALADFMQSGELARHLRKMRGILRSRQTVLKMHLAEAFGDAIRIWGGAAGAHVTIVFNEATDDQALSARAAALGVTARPLSAYATSPHTSLAYRGLVLGYGMADENMIPPLVRRLRRAYLDLLGGARS